MRCRVLSVLPDSAQLEWVKDILEAELTNIIFDFTTNEAKALEKLNSRTYELIVTSLDIPKDGKDLAWEGLRRGLGLARWAENHNVNIRTILLAKVGDADLDKALVRLERCELVILKLGWEDLFIKRVRQTLAGEAPPERKRLDVDIRLYLDKRRVEASMKGVGFLCNIESRLLDIPSKEFLDLTAMSRKVEDEFSGHWQSKLQDLGKELMRYIFEKNFGFAWDFKEYVTKAGGLGNARIRFVVEKEFHPIVLEAIYGPHEELEKDYWMLHAPIYRTVAEYGGLWDPLFHNQETRKGPLNILIIESPTEGEVVIRERGTDIEARRITLKPLMNVIEECEFLRNYRSSPEYSGRVKIGKVELIPRSDDPTPFVDQVREALEPGKQVWHIVHYAGHSYFDRDTNKGYVFFPGGKDEKGDSVIKEVDLDLLSVWLRKARPNFVFLSSCHSSEEGFVFALARNQIPAIVGFRWDIEDDAAAEYVRLFYRTLFSGEHELLEYVFLKARQEIHNNNRYRDNPIWAAPVLVMQIPSV